MLLEALPQHRSLPIVRPVGSLSMYSEELCQRFAQLLDVHDSSIDSQHHRFAFRGVVE